MPARDEMLWKGLATAAAVVAGIGARNAATAGWRRAAGGDPPSNPADPDTSWGEALGWTVMVGVLVGIARLVARRSAAELWQRRAGGLPRALEDVSA